METHHIQKNIKSTLHFALAFQLLYLFTIGFVNFLSTMNLIPQRIISIYLSYDKFVPVTDYVTIISTCIITIMFFLVYKFLFKKMKNEVRATKLHTLQMGLYVFGIYYVLPLFSTFCIIKLRTNNLYSTLEEIYSVSVLDGVQSWMRIFQFVAVTLLLCAYAMYWYESNIASTKE